MHFLALQLLAIAIGLDVQGRADTVMVFIGTEDLGIKCAAWPGPEGRRRWYGTGNACLSANGGAG